jgi:hypothetical protein
LSIETRQTTLEFCRITEASTPAISLPIAGLLQRR